MRKITLILGLLFYLMSNCFLIYCDSEKKSTYSSLCLKPTFSPDEKVLVFWDRFDVKISLKKFVLKTYEVNTCRTKKILERISQTPSEVCYSEIFEDFQNIKWSPNGKFLAIALNGVDLEILDFKSLKIVAKLRFLRKNKDFFFGYFYVKWIDNNTIVAGYLSKYAGLQYTDDTYGLIVRKGEIFKIKKRVLNRDSEFIPDNSIDGEPKNSFEEYKQCIPILELDKANKVKSLNFLRESLLSPSELFDIPKDNSLEKVVISISGSGKFAILAGVGLYDPIKHRSEIKTELFEVPSMFRDKIIKCLNENK
ncbi:MAG: hypothetical protein GY757_28920 [bacterium]|nr:hypothetical protein [bacterium]